MRMSLEGPSAADLLNTLDGREIARILQVFGEEGRPAESPARSSRAATNGRSPAPAILSPSARRCSAPSASARSTRRPARSRRSASRSTANSTSLSRPSARRAAAGRRRAARRGHLPFAGRPHRQALPRRAQPHRCTGLPPSARGDRATGDLRAVSRAIEPGEDEVAAIRALVPQSCAMPCAPRFPPALSIPMLSVFRPSSPPAGGPDGHDRFVNALLVFLMVLSAAAVYDMKYEAETAAVRAGRPRAEDRQRAIGTQPSQGGMERAHPAGPDDRAGRALPGRPPAAAPDGRSDRHARDIPEKRWTCRSIRMPPFRPARRARSRSVQPKRTAQSTPSRTTRR